MGALGAVGKGVVADVGALFGGKKRKGGAGQTGAV